MEQYEVMGSFYLGKAVDRATGARQPAYLMYDANDLTTHAMCVGMTGSGKTGLCIDLLEEAAIDGVPAIVVDPKGDIANLLLMFPDMQPADFQPWIQESAASGRPLAEAAAETAALWKNGLAEWEQTPDRIRLLQSRTSVEVYTPGSTMVRPLSILQLFTAPSPAVCADAELVSELAGGAADALLGLLGLDTDPIRSRERIFLSRLLMDCWQRGVSLSLGDLIAAVQQPPVTQIGVMPLETFYPEKERFGLAMQINGMLASPQFEPWLAGDPLDIDRLLYSCDGRPQIAILSISHLNDQDRMFFVSVLLNRLVAWMRRQNGTGSLRALFYMDEIFGYFPPVANPPSKGPLLTLLKQARAYGLGLMLTTQNPMDLDYKGLSNIGTWFIGRLQTDRDRERLLDGLSGAQDGAAPDRAALSALLAGLGKRVFLMRNVHDPEPVLFESRWCLSYLAGPLSRPQLQLLTGKRPSDAVAVSAAPAVPMADPMAAAPVFGSVPGAAAPVSGTPPATSGLPGMDASAAGTIPAGHAAAAAPPDPVAAAVPPAVPGVLPLLPSDVQQFVLPAAGGTPDQYRPALLGVVDVTFRDQKTGASDMRRLTYLTPVTDALLPVDWSEACPCRLDMEQLSQSLPAGVPCAPLNPAAEKKTNYTAWGRQLADHVYRTETLAVLFSPYLKLYAGPGENEREFRIRLHQLAREKRDAEMAALRSKYESKIKTMESRLMRAEQAVQRESAQAAKAKADVAVSIGSTLLGAFLGRRAVSQSTVSRAAGALRSTGRQRQQAADVDRAKDTVESVQQDLEALQQELEAALQTLDREIQTRADEVTRIEVKPQKQNCRLQVLALVWQPFAGGTALTGVTDLEFDAGAASAGYSAGDGWAPG